jgi:putative aldouronate transport system substrate-binding protein
MAGFIYRNIFLRKAIMKKVWMIVLLVLLVCGFSFAGGGNEKSDTGNSPSAGLNVKADPNLWKAKYPETVTVYIGRDPGPPAYPAGVTYENNAYTKWIKDTFNIEVKAAFLVTGDDFKQRVTLAIASNDLPDVLLLNDRLQLNQLMESGMVQDLTGLFDQYASPLFKAQAKTYGDTLEQSMFTSFYEGRQFSISDLNPSPLPHFWVREDWRLKLGLPKPETTQDFINLAKAFVQNDMAGNGMTVGFEVQEAIAGIYGGNAVMDPYFNELGSYPRQWHDDGTGKLVYGSVAPRTKDALKVLRDLYSANLIPKDFATRDWIASVSSGYSGILVGEWWIPVWPLNYTVQNNPNAIWQVYDWKGTKTGKLNHFQHIWNTSWGVVRKGYAHPEVLIKLLNASTESQVDYDGETLTAEQKKSYDFIVPQNVIAAYDVSVMWSYWPTNLAIRFKDMLVKLGDMQKASLERYKKGERNLNASTLDLVSDIVKYENGDHSLNPWMNYQRYQALQIRAKQYGPADYKPIFYPVTTETMELRWSNLVDLENNSFYKIIMGSEPLDYFDTFVKQWYNQGGTRITSEVNAQYKK